MKKQYIALCVPSRGITSIHFAHCLLNLQWPLNTGHVHNFVTGTPQKIKPVAEARNECIATMLAFEEGENRELTHIFWVDDDVLIQPTALMKLWSLRKPIASGVYFTKQVGGHPVAFPAPGCGAIEYIPDSIQEAGVVGLGICLIQMSVFHAMKAKLDLGRDSQGNIEFHRYSGTKLEHDCIIEREGEDAYFCRRAAELGYKPVVDCSRHAFGLHYDLETGKAYPEKQAKQIVCGEQVVWETSQGPMGWRE